MFIVNKKCHYITTKKKPTFASKTMDYVIIRLFFIQETSNSGDHDITCGTAVPSNI